jgi:hypothetical protein
LRPEAGNQDEKQARNCADHGRLVDYSAWLRNNSERSCVSLVQKALGFVCLPAFAKFGDVPGTELVF